jgi:hypothetical protein
MQAAGRLKSNSRDPLPGTAAVLLQIGGRPSVSGSRQSLDQAFFSAFASASAAAAASASRCAFTSGGS